MIEYEELLEEESKCRKTTMGISYLEVINPKVAEANLPSTGSFTCPLLVEKTSSQWNKSQASNAQAQYTFDVANTKEVFDFLMKEKFHFSLGLPTPQQIRS